MLKVKLTVHLIFTYPVFHMWVQLRITVQLKQTVLCTSVSIMLYVYCCFCYCDQ